MPYVFDALQVQIRTLGWNADGKRLASGATDGYVRVYSASLASELVCWASLWESNLGNQQQNLL